MGVTLVVGIGGDGACKTKKLTLPLSVMYIAYKAEK